MVVSSSLKYVLTRGFLAMADILASFGTQREIFYSAVIADTLDGLGHRTGVLPARIRPLAPHWKIFGRAVTLAMVPIATEPEVPYRVEMECIDSLRPGDILVATTHGDFGSALWGELLSTACQARGAVGAVLDGLTRDTGRILAMDFPVFAAGFTPLDSKGRLDGIGYNVPIKVGDCIVHPGDWVFADVDGVVVVPNDLAENTFSRALEKVTGENRVREELAAGKSVRETFAKYGIL
jgi:4-hydroxy-4-methyl-2-oxoglutarate aldolase